MSLSFLWRSAFLLFPILVGAGGAYGEDAPMTERELKLVDLVQRLEKRVETLERRLDEQESEELGQSNTKVVEAPESAPKAHPSPARPEEMRVYWKDGVRMETEDGQFKLRLGGRIQNDWAWFHQDRCLQRAFGNTQDGTEFRRSRLYLSGLLYGNIEFKAEYDFVGGDADFKDVYMALSGIPAIGNIRVGHFREPFGLEERISDYYRTFIERGLPAAFAPGRSTGAMIYGRALQDRFIWELGAFRTADDFGDGSDDGDYVVAGRIAGLPWYVNEGRRLLHLGAAYSHRSRDGDLRFRARPEAHLSDFRYVDTGIFETEDMGLFGLEAAVKAGAFTLQGEYMRADVDSVRRKVFTNVSFRDGEEVGFDGYYLAASYLFAGNERPYNLRKGAFGRVRPLRNFSLREGGGWGAFEIGLRYSSIDLNDGFIRGGTEDNWTLGLNWYLNPHARVMLNYVRAEIERDVPGSAGRFYSRSYSGDLDVLQTRFQVDF